jgi:hypothetical protein
VGTAPESSRLPLSRHWPMSEERVTTGSEPTVRLHRCPECRQVRDTTDAAPFSTFQCEGWEDEPHAAQRMLPEAYAL